MRDCGHCMMPYDKDDEFESFYDFARAYRELPQKPMIMAAEEAEDAAAEERKIERNQRMASKSNSSASNKSNDSG